MIKEQDLSQDFIGRLAIALLLYWYFC